MTETDAAADPAPVVRADRSEDLARRATEALREMIASRELSPGEQIRQGELAAKIGVSRSPLREALRILHQDGLLTHKPHSGYFVARLNSDELTQVYRMRELIEDALLGELRTPDHDTLQRLRDLNAQMSRDLESGAIGALLANNRAFHYAIFDLSPSTLLAREARRLWRMSEPYQAAYLLQPATRERIVLEHEAIVSALAASDHAAALALLRAHRSAGQSNVLRLLH